MKREQIQALYKTVGRNPPAQIDGNVWDEFYTNRNPDFHAAFSLRKSSDFVEIRISSWVFSPESVKAPWVKTQFEKWRKDNPLEGLDVKFSHHKKNRGRTQEGHLIDIHIPPLDFQSEDQSSIFRDWFSRFFRFVEELPEKWSNAGLQWNSNNKEEIQRYLETFFVDEPQIDNPNDAQKREMVTIPTEDEDSSNSNLDPRNLIYFGAPGTGKSHQLKEAVEGKLDEDGKVIQAIEKNIGVFVDVDKDKIVKRRYERVTFYPTYSYAQFVGCYKPVMKPKVGEETGEEEIAYEFVPGPFLRILVEALNDPENRYCLVIEEINRANAAAVFGDVFQLLDRDEKGQSEYDIAATEDMRRHLDKALSDTGKETLKKLAGEGNLKIPANMYIWATMNSADQGVFPMDTAFKRRWAFKYIGINDGVTDDCKKWTIKDYGFLWNAVRTFLNDRLTANGVNEDKLMGPWFVKPENGSAVSLDQFRSKVLMYLWEDAARMCRRKLFGDSIKTYSDLVENWPRVFRDQNKWEEVMKQTNSADVGNAAAKVDEASSQGVNNPAQN